MVFFAEAKITVFIFFFNIRGGCNDTCSMPLMHALGTSFDSPTSFRYFERIDFLTPERPPKQPTK